MLQLRVWYQGSSRCMFKSLSLTSCALLGLYSLLPHLWGMLVVVYFSLRADELPNVSCGTFYELWCFHLDESGSWHSWGVSLTLKQDLMLLGNGAALAISLTAQEIWSFWVFQEFLLWISYFMISLSEEGIPALDPNTYLTLIILYSRRDKIGIFFSSQRLHL